MKQDNFKMDSRNVEDIHNQIGNLAKSYVPEWNFDPSNPDIGSVLALIFANQMGRNVERFNGMMERYRTELVNLMEISPLPAKPAEVTVLMNIASEADEGIAIPEESRLLAELEDEKIVFETAFPVYLTPSKLRTIFMTSAEKGSVLPILGGLKRKNYVAEEKISEVEETGMKPFDLFQFAKEGIERQAVVLYHRNIFDVESETIYCRIEGNADLLRKIKSGDIRFLYYSEDGFIPVENCQVMGEHILLVKEKPNKKVSLNHESYSVFVLEAKEPQKESITIASIAFSSAGSPRYAEYIGNGMTDYEVERFYLFGDTLTLFAECYIGLNHYFEKKGSKISLSFHASFEERAVGISKQEEDNLKIIKRKPKAAEEVHVSYAYPEEISIEYFNGIGWKRLQCDKEYRRMFAEANEGDYELRFNCPEDWADIEIGAYHGRTLRIQLLRSDNCYYQPCQHQIPIISDLMVAYTYENKFVKPEVGMVFSGTDVTDITKTLQKNVGFTAFSKGNYNDTSLYLGFDKKFEQGPISLWWQIEGDQRDQNLKLHFYYSTVQGFKEMKVIDYTAGLTRSGIMMFLPPSDMALVSLEGERRCWIKITNESTKAFYSDIKINKIELNAVTAFNIETLPVEEFYLDEVQTKLSFPLGADGILDAEVWVNEKNELSVEAMEKMREEMPERVRLERNYLGEISEFYVKWEETDQFYYSKAEDRHYILDRMNKRILFGNGIQVKVPRNMDGVAFTVKLRCCRGVKGNVPAGTITESSSNWLFVQDIYNPEAAFGGSNMETMDRVLQRGAGILSARGRLVTEQDYERAALHFSDTIDKVSVISGYGKDGTYHEKMLYIVLLMKDFLKGKNSFYRMQNELKQHLLKHCELSIEPDELQIEAPIFVSISVDVWASVLKIEDSFEIQNLAKEALENYLNPVRDIDNQGWNIGVLPRKSQIMMKLNALKSRALIRHIVVTAKYEDETGIHEVDIEQLKVSPFMVVVNGIHHIHISPMEEV